MLSWTVDPVTAWIPNYSAYARDISEVVEDVLAARVPEIVQWMKDNHPWRNRTGLAEANINAALVRDGMRIAVYVYHPWQTVERRPSGDKYYPIYLERYMAGGAYGVLAIAMDYWAPILIADVQKAIT